MCSSKEDAQGEGSTDGVTLRQMEERMSDRLVKRREFLGRAVAVSLLLPVMGCHKTVTKYDANGRSYEVQEDDPLASVLLALLILIIIGGIAAVAASSKDDEKKNHSSLKRKRSTLASFSDYPAEVTLLDENGIPLYLDRGIAPMVGIDLLKRAGIVELNGEIVVTLERGPGSEYRVVTMAQNAVPTEGGTWDLQQEAEYDGRLIRTRIRAPKTVVLDDFIVRPKVMTISILPVCV